MDYYRITIALSSLEYAADKLEDYAKNTYDWELVRSLRSDAQLAMKELDEWIKVKKQP